MNAPARLTPKHPGPDRQPSPQAGVRGLVHDWVFRDALPENLRPIFEGRFTNNVPPGELAAELGVSPGFVRWAERAVRRRLDHYAHLIRNNDIGRGTPAMSRKEAAAEANKAGQTG